MRTFLLLAFSASIAALLVGLVAYHYWPTAGQHRTIRTKVINYHAEQARWPVVVVGDSIAELAHFDSLCGAPALNAGISGITTGNMAPIAIDIIMREKPTLVVVQLGTNDSAAGNSTQDKAFAENYGKIIETAHKQGAQVIAMPLAQTADFGGGSKFDNTVIARRNEQIRGFGVTVAPLSIERLDRESSDDGVHPNSSGYVLWRNAIEAACQDIPS